MSDLGSEPVGPALPGSWRRRTLALGVGLGLTASACGTSGFQLGSRSVTACFRAVATASASTHDAHARLLGVHRLSDRRAREYLTVELAGGAAMDTSVCVVAFEGPFGPNQVSGAPPGAAGRYAIVFVTTRGLRVVGAAVTDHVPGRLRGHAF